MDEYFERMALLGEIFQLGITAEKMNKYNMPQDLDIISNACNKYSENSNLSFADMNIKDLKRLAVCLRTIQKVMETVHEGAKILGDDSIIDVDDSFFK